MTPPNSMPHPPSPRPRNSAGTDPPSRRREPDLLRICGFSAVAAVFGRAPDRVERLFFDEETMPVVGEFCRALALAHKPYRRVGDAELARVAGTILHGGVVAIARPRPVEAFDPAKARGWAVGGKPLLVLDGVGNPHNLGAIVRTAAFFGVERILLAERPDQALPSDASYRIAEGGFEYLDLYRTRLPPALAALRPSYRIIGAALDPRAKPWRPAARPAALVLGNEETGIDRATLAACDEIVAIPGSGNLQSLNVSAAAAILIYELSCR